MKSVDLHRSQVHAHVHAHALPSSVLQRVTGTLLAWQRRARERSELAQLDAWTLRDLGLSADDIWREVKKPRWQQ
jgi:uncharacterized protein YjiS (DUF1127 family)